MRATACLRLSVGMCLSALAATATAQNAMTTESADVYAGPDNSYPEVAQLDPDTPIQVMGCLDDWSWCDVGFEGSRGWVYSPDIAYQYQGGYAPLYSYAPGLGVPVVAFSFDTYWGSYYHDRPFYQQREQWAHRTISHRRPPGPRPSSSPPPRQAIRDIHPREGADHGVRLGSAKPSREPNERAGAGARIQAPAPDPRHQDRSPPAAPRPETNARPPGNAAPQHSVEPQRNAEPQRSPEPQHETPHEDQHAHPGARVESQSRAEPPHAEPQHRAEPSHPAPEKPEPPKS
jgi:uncharacterized protein YraI